MTESDAPDDRWGTLQAEAMELVDAAGERGLTLRLIGSTAVRAHCAPAARAVDTLGRPPKDIDLVCERRDRDGVRRLLEERSYVVDQNMLVAMEGARYLYSHSEHELEIDLFVDRLEFCHTIDLRGRLEQSPHTTSLEDLVLQKLQIVDLKPSDVLDLTALLSVHSVSDDPGREAIDRSHIARVLSRDWGFHRTATQNLGTLEQRISNGTGAALDDAALLTASAGVGELVEAIDDASKSRGWKLRARIGERVQWWSDVGERTQTY